MNGALAKVASALPVCPRPGAVAVGDRTLNGKGLACLAIGPNPDVPTALIGIVGGTDAEGIALSGASRTIVSGMGVPDFCIWSGRILEEGIGGVEAAGFLDAEWKVDPADTYEAPRNR